MYVMNPGGAPPAGPVIWALDATNGKLLWEYRRPTGGTVNTKTFALYDDMIFYPAPDGFIVALDAKTGAVRWETKAVEGSGRLTGGLVMAGDKIISGRTCGGSQSGCYIAAHDAKTGKEVWKFFTAAGADDPVGDKSWGGTPVERRTASTWGLTGSYDPVRKLAIWGVANPTPNTRSARHQGNSNAIGMSAPADLYSNSTVAIDIETGKLKWYYQHLPGDDWDQDYTNERILLRTDVNPNSKFLKWINPDIPRGQRDISVSVGEGGGLFALDRETGKFLWATPFPYDTPRFLISRIDLKTGTTYINEDLIVDQPGERHIICAYNTKSYWPMAYHPGKNSLYIPYVDNCLDMTSAVPAGQTAVENTNLYTSPDMTCAGPSVPDAPAVTPAAAAVGAPQGGGGGRGGAGGGGAQGGGGGRGGGGGGAAGAAAGGRGAAGGGGAGERRVAIRREGSDPKKFSGIAKVNVQTGELTRFFEGCAPGNGATLATAGDLVFWGDLARQFRAFDADSGKVLWETTLPGSIQNSTISYGVNGKQYIAVLTGRGAMSGGLITQAGITPAPLNSNGVYVFALP
jgi:glucose dehydrogenase